MTLKLRHRRVAPKTTLINGGSTTIEIPQDNPLRRITLNFEQKNTNGSGTTSPVLNGFLKVVKRIRIVMDGFDNKFDVDLETYNQANIFQNGTSPFISLVTTPATTSTLFTSESTFTIDFGQLKNNLNDFSGLLNAPALSSLNLIIDYGTQSDVVATTGGSPSLVSTVDISIDEVYDNGVGENQLPEVVLNAQDFREGLDVELMDGTFNSFGSSEFPVKILPVPSTILEHCIFTTISSTGLDSSNVKSLKLENVRGGGELLFIDEFQNVRQQGKAEYSLEFGNTNIQGLTLPPASIFISWSELRLEGLLNNVVDALKYKFLNNTSTATKIRIYKKFLVATASV
jgi:hypothetical protein